MNDVAMKALLKLAKNFLSPDMIKQAAEALLKAAIDYKNEVPLNPDAGETESAGMVWERAGIAYFGIAILNNENHILRVEKITTFSVVTENIIKKM